MSLLDTIDMVLAFAFVMLLLSMFVTVMVQLTQSAFKLRNRYLREAILRLAEELGADEQDAGRIADQILRPLSLDRDGSSGQGRVRLRSNELVTAVTAREFQSLIPAFAGAGLNETRAATVANVESPAGLNAAAMMGALSQESLDSVQSFSGAAFGRSIKGITIVWALIIAFVLQVSAPALLTTLSVDQDLRAQLVLGAVAAEAGERPSGETDEGMDMQQAIADANAGYMELARFNLVPWSQGTGFYFDTASSPEAVSAEAEPAAQGFLSRIQFSNLLGVGLTALLLMLGAPFWYDLIGKLVGLRDKLQERADATPGS